MRCSAAVFLSQGAHDVSVGRQPLTSRNNSASAISRGAPLDRQPSATPLEPSHERSERVLSTLPPHARHVQRREGAAGVAHRHRIPRPVTARQLYAAVLDVPVAGGGGTGCTVQGISGRAASSDCSPYAAPASAMSRVGESTILVDGVALHAVVVCGRVVRFDAAVPVHTAAGAITPVCSTPFSAPPPLFDVVWISDNTGLLCVLRHHHHSSQMLNGDLALSSTMHDTLVMTEGRGLDGVGSGEVPPGSAAAAQILSLPPTRDTLASTRCPSPWTPSHACALGHVSGGDETNATEADEEAFYPGDYVVCTGVLAFADVDRSVATVLSRDAALLRDAAWAAVSTRRTNPVPIPREEEGAGSCGAAAAAAETGQERARRRPDHTHVLLPGSAVPLRVDAAEAAFGLIGAFPPQTRFMTEREALQWEEGDAGAVHTSPLLPSYGEPRTDTTATVELPERVDSFPLFCVKGRPRLLPDSNESLYWWLSAVETHLRLRGDNQR